MVVIVMEMLMSFLWLFLGHHLYPSFEDHIYLFTIIAHSDTFGSLPKLLRILTNKIMASQCLHCTLTGHLIGKIKMSDFQIPNISALKIFSGHTIHSLQWNS